MAAKFIIPPPTKWSQCSRDQLATGLSDKNLNKCLKNQPTHSIEDPQCGNGLLDPGEHCDCGPASVSVYNYN